MEELIMTKMSIQEILKKKGRGLISPHHSLQRLPGQWSPKDKGNFISDILQGLLIDPLKLGEENLNGGKILWILDGVQRVTNVEDYVNNSFSVAKNIERYMIEYVVSVVDEDGVPMKDENGKPVTKIESFDIRGKKFKQLPSELQDEFLYYKFNVFLHPDCSAESIAYHLKRYNAGKPMNTEQKGFTYIGDHNANIVRRISTLSFFEDAIGKYTANDFKVGKINRVIAESLMTTRFLDAWDKNFADNCKYINKNATDDDFEELGRLIECVEEFIDPEVGQMFNATNSFLWFGLYSKFIKLGLDNDNFNVFMSDLNKGMYSKDDRGKVIKDAPMTGICTIEIDGTTYEELLKNTATKDANVVKNRIIFLTELMCQYFGVEMPTEAHEGNKKNAMTPVIDSFVEEFISTEIPHNTKETALKTLMQFTSYPIRDFSDEGVVAFEHWLSKENIPQEILEDCALSTCSLRDYLNNAGAADKFSANDIAILIHRIYADGEDLDQNAFELWLDDFNNFNHCEESGSNNALLEKESFMRNSYETFVKENNKGE